MRQKAMELGWVFLDHGDCRLMVFVGMRMYIHLYSLVIALAGKLRKVDFPIQ